jgi:hypothetical protein
VPLDHGQHLTYLGVVGHVDVDGDDFNVGHLILRFNSYYNYSTFNELCQQKKGREQN